MTAQRLRLRCGIMASRVAERFSKERHSRDARFAKLHELAPLISSRVDLPSLILGIGPYFHPLRVHGTAKRPELGNMLVNGPTRCGKGLLATSQILTWEGSVIVNDIKGELYEKTAGYRNRLGPVYRFDPTGYSHRYDPTAGKHTEDDLHELANYLLYDPQEKEGKVFTLRATKMLTQMFLGAVRGPL